MTNEDLVVAIQHGRTDLMLTLWNQIERLVSWKANKVVSSLGNNGPIEFDDLYNSGYIALCNAVERYHPERGAFSTHFMLHLKTAFAEATGYRSERQQRDPIHRASSFDDPVPGTDNMVLCDFISDGTDLEDDTIEKIWQQQLHDALEDALDDLPEREEQAIRAKYYRDEPVETTAFAMGITESGVSKLRQSGLNRLRRDPAKLLEPFIDAQTNFYIQTGSRTQKSPVELLVLRREELRNKYLMD